MEGSGEAMVRREAVEAEREMVWLREKKRRVEAERFTGAALGMDGESGGESGPRSEFRRWMAVVQSVQGCWWDSPMWPQPLLAIVSLSLSKWLEVLVYCGRSAGVEHHGGLSCSVPAG